MKQVSHVLHVQTKGKGLYNISRAIESWVRNQQLRTGLVTVFIRHTSASLTIQENADPDVVSDLNEFFERLVPENQKWYRHTIEGPDDMPAHIKAALTQSHLTIPIHEGHLALGTWQGIYVFEHRADSHQRSVVLHLLGEE